MARDRQKSQQQEELGGREWDAQASPLSERQEHPLVKGAEEPRPQEPAAPNNGVLPPRGAANPADDVTRSVRRHWKIVGLVTLAVTLLAWTLAATQPKRYRATSTVAVTPVTRGMAPAEVQRGVDTLDRRVVISTVAALASTPATLAQSGAGPGDHVEAAVLPMTSLFSVTVEGSDAAHVTAVANAIPRSLDAQTRSMFSVYGVALASPAAAPAKAALPRPERAVMAGLVAGLLAGVAVAYFIDRRRAASGR